MPRWQRKVSGGKFSRSDAALEAGRADSRVHNQAQMIYLDTSCLFKLLREEPESADVRSAVDAEDEVIVSSLTELETFAGQSSTTTTQSWPSGG